MRLWLLAFTKESIFRSKSALVRCCPSYKDILRNSNLFGPSSSRFHHNKSTKTLNNSCTSLSSKTVSQKPSSPRTRISTHHDFHVIHDVREGLFSWQDSRNSDHNNLPWSQCNNQYVVCLVDVENISRSRGVLFGVYWNWWSSGRDASDSAFGIALVEIDEIAHYGMCYRWPRCWRALVIGVQISESWISMARPGFASLALQDTKCHIIDSHW